MKNIANTQELVRYKNQLSHQWSLTNTMGELLEFISNELTNYGIYEWAYTQLDLPDHRTVLDNLGTMDSQYIDYYISQNFHNNDFLLRHAKLSNTPCFQSDIETNLKNMSFAIEGKEKYLELIKNNKAYGYDDVFSIPITSGFDGSRFLLSLTTRCHKPQNFKRATRDKIHWLFMVGLAITETGVQQYPEYFVTPMKKFKDFKSSRKVDLLQAMVKNDLSVSRAAKKIGIQYSTAQKHLTDIRNMLGAQENHAICSLAVQYGIITL